MDPASVHFVISLRIISRKYYDKGSSKYFRTFIVLQFLLMLQHAGGKTWLQDRLRAVTISLGRYIGQRDDNMIESRKIDFLNGRLLTGDKKDCTNMHGVKIG